MVEERWLRAMREGRSVRDADVYVLEAVVAAKPDHVEARLKLLAKAHYDRRGPGVDHVLWFVEHEPGSDVAASILCIVDRDTPDYARVRDAWTTAVATHADDTNVIYNASQFFYFSGDHTRARELLELGERLAPTSPVWAHRLATLLAQAVERARDTREPVGAPRHTPDELHAMAREALRHYERALALTTDAGERFRLVPHLAEAAYAATEAALALRYADETLALAPDRADERHRPDYVHDAHIVRGRVALDAGDVAGAARELHAAGAQGSLEAPVLRSFGPDFHLANGLLARGERAAVLAYLAQCLTFWKERRVARWIAAIESGGTPHLFKGFDPGEHPDLPRLA